MLKNKELQFDAGDHKYYIDGSPVPSVSEIVGLMTGDVYGGIPAHILQKASEFGTAVHEMIELYNLTGIIMATDDYRKDYCLAEWVGLSREFDDIIEHEFKTHYKGIYAGTFDSIAVKNNKLILIDYKTTQKYHDEKITLQLNLYRIAYEWQTGKKIDEMAGVWLPKLGYGKIQTAERLDDEWLIKGVKDCIEKQNTQQLASG